MTTATDLIRHQLGLENQKDQKEMIQLFLIAGHTKLLDAVGRNIKKKTKFYSL